MSKESREQKLEKARKLEDAIKRIRDNKEEKSQIFHELGLSYKPKTYYALKKKYEENGLTGLISQKGKCGRKAIPPTDALRRLILDVKIR